MQSLSLVIAIRQYLSVDVRVRARHRLLDLLLGVEDVLVVAVHEGLHVHVPNSK